MQKYQVESSGWTIDSVIEQNINFSKYKPLSGSGYIKLPKELNHSRKSLIYIQNFNDNECLKLCLGRYLNPSDHYLARIRKIDKILPENVEIGKIQNIEKKNCISISVFDYESKEKFPIYISKNTFKKHVDFLLYVLIMSHTFFRVNPHSIAT